MNEKNNVNFVIFEVCKCKTQAEFAKLVGVSRQVVTNWKRRGYFPSESIPNLCQKTGLPPFVFNAELKPTDLFEAHMKTNWLFKQVVKRGMKKRLSDVLSGSYFGASLNRDAMDFTQKIIRDEWDGDERNIPHFPTCSCFDQSKDGNFFNHPCTCGMTALAQGRYLTAFKKFIYFLILELKNEVKEHEALLSGSEEQILDPRLRKMGIAGLKHVLFQRHNSLHRMYFPFEKDSYRQIVFSPQELSQLIESRSESNHGADQQRT